MTRGELSGPVTAGRWQLTQLGPVTIGGRAVPGVWRWKLARGGPQQITPDETVFRGTTGAALKRLRAALEDERYRAEQAAKLVRWRRTQLAGHRDGRHSGTVDTCPRCQKFDPSRYKTI